MVALLLALAPTALADHVYSHRLYVVGRVIDVDGRPAAGVPVEVTLANISATGGCFDGKPERTDARGDFEVCRHAHVIPQGASAIVRVGNATREARIDPDLRLASVRVQLDAPTAHDLVGEREVARTYRVIGRAVALLPAPVEEEGVPVNATPLFANVTVEMRVLDRVLATREVTPDLYGTYRVDLEVDGVPPAAVVRVSVGRDAGEDVVSPAFRWSAIHVLRDLRLVGGPGEDAPGSSAVPGVGVSLAILAITCVARSCRRPR